MKNRINPEEGYFVRTFDLKESECLRDDLFTLCEKDIARQHIIRKEAFFIEGDRLQDLLNSNLLSVIYLKKEKENTLIYNMAGVIVGCATPFEIKDDVRKNLFKKTNAPKGISENTMYRILPIKAEGNYVNKNFVASIADLDPENKVDNGCEVPGSGLKALQDSFGLTALSDPKTQTIELYDTKNNLVACAIPEYETIF